jgi:UDP-N-acetylmuramyl pentapeptide phosphotransferase/UDP-N-acetylglucosamine-1-phosphate transferase
MYLIPGIVGLLLITTKQWIQLFRSSRSRSLNLVILVMLSILGGYSVLWRTTDRPEMLFVLNAMLVVLSIGCIRESLETKRRSQFWYGLLVLVVLIASRFLEYETELILKSAILTLCGFGIIAAGIWFEKYAGRSRTTLPSDSSGDLNP